MFSIINSHKGTIFAALVAPLFVLALPILDTTLAILRRGLRGLPIFRADRRHLHHHLLQTGLSRRKVVLSFYAVTLLFLAMAFAAYWSRGHLIPVLLGVGTLLLLLCAGRLRFSRGWFAVHRIVGESLNMRQEIQYALTLMRWLALEGGRRNSAEELWSDLVFAVQRLGYTSARLVLADGQRVWEQTSGGPATRAVVQELQGGRLGTLELKASICQTGEVPVEGAQPCDASDCFGVVDEQVFEIVSELVAEGWIGAVSKLQNGDRGPLRFETRRSKRRNPQPRRFSAFVAPAQVPQTVRETATPPAEAFR